MENKDLGIALISILVGSSLGFGASWFILNPKIEEIQSSLDIIIYDTVNEFAHASWHSAFYIYEDDIVTDNFEVVVMDNFEIKGKEIRIVWEALGKTSISGICIAVFFGNGTYYAKRASSGIYSCFACDLCIPEPGKYYLEITTCELEEYTISIWDYY